MEKLRNVIVRLRTSLGLLPAVMSAFAVVLAWVLLYSGFDLGSFGDGEAWWLFSGDPGTARDLLSSILSGMITMTSLVVSITMVVLSLAAGQLGPRLIDNFMKDRQIQAVLGLFMSTIVYSLFVLRSLNEEVGEAVTPHAAVTVASALAMLCLFALLFYVQKIARSIIADTVVTEVADDLEKAIENARHEPDGDEGDDEKFSQGSFSQREWLSLGKAGYVQLIDHERLVRLASDNDLLIRLDIRAGHFILATGQHVQVSSNQSPSDDLLAEIAQTVVIGSSRTPTQDLEYSVRQLVEIAVRAMSSGVNDPFTAILVINRLGAALESLCQYPPVQARYRNKDNRLCVLTSPHDFSGILDASFNQIRQASVADAAVLMEMTNIIAQLALVVDVDDRRLALLGHLDKIQRAAHRHLDEQSDIDDFMGVAAVARRRLSSDAPAFEPRQAGASERNPRAR